MLFRSEVGSDELYSEGGERRSHSCFFGARFEKGEELSVKLAVEELKDDGWLHEDFSGDDEHMGVRGR